MASLGSIIVGAGQGLWNWISGNSTTTRKFLVQQGDGSESATPIWDTIQPGDLPGATFGTVLTADPVSPADDTWWVVRTGSTPELVAIKARIGGVTYVIASMEH